LPLGTAQKLKNLQGFRNSILYSISREDIRLVYTFKSRLGSGSFGTVRIAYKTVNPGKAFAVKSIKRNQIEKSKDEEQELNSELMLLSSVDHPNIVKLLDVYEDEKHFFLVMELMTGGEVSVIG